MLARYDWAACLAVLDDVYADIDRAEVLADGASTDASLHASGEMP
jgi:hypothetical protein